MPPSAPTTFHWLKHGNEAFPRMLAAIGRARHSIRMETYTFKESLLGTRFLDALTAAARRGVTVKAMADYVGSRALRSSFWEPLQKAGGAFRWFNPFNVWRLGIRDHRKILVCDDATAFVGGFNIAPEYEGDGRHQGWRDLGLEIHGGLAAELARAFDEAFQRADFKHRPLERLRRTRFNKSVSGENWTLLLSGPGRGRNHLKRALAQDIAAARDIGIMTAYFLPTWRIRRELLRAARRGADARLLLAGKTDVGLAQLAARCLYGQFLRAGTKIYEYRPQVLHAKLLLLDNVVYVGSANLDARSMNINYELMVRVEDAELAREAREIFARDLRHSRRVIPAAWKKARPLWQRWFERAAYFILARLDPLLSRWQTRDVP